MAGLCVRGEQRLRLNFSYISGMQNHMRTRTIDPQCFTWADQQSKTRRTLAESPAQALSKRSTLALSALRSAGLVAAVAQGNGSCTFSFPDTERKCTAPHFQSFANALLNMPLDGLPLVLVELERFRQEHHGSVMMRTSLLVPYSSAYCILRSCSNNQRRESTWTEPDHSHRCRPEL